MLFLGGINEIAFDKNATTNKTSSHGSNLVQTGLLHDADELFLADFAIAITVGLVNHFLQLLICHVLTQLLSNTLQVPERDLASLIIIEQAESLNDLLHWITLTLKGESQQNTGGQPAVQRKRTSERGVWTHHFSSHHLEELIEVDGARTILVNVLDHLFNFLLLGLETKRTHGNFQLLGIDCARAIGVEKIERFTNLLLLLLSQFKLATLLLATGVGTTVCVSLREWREL